MKHFACEFDFTYTCRSSLRIAGACLCAALLTSNYVAAQDEAAQNLHRKHHHRHYTLHLVDTFGGPGSYLGFGPSRVLTRNGAVVGFADTNIDETLLDALCAPDICDIQRSFTYHDGKVTQLPSLTGGTSALAHWANDRGWVVGASETGVLNPGGFPETAPVLWRDDQITNLGTFGGTAGYASAVNNRGEVVGGASNGVGGDQHSMLDGDYFAFSFLPEYTQSRAFLWKDGALTDLGTLGGLDSIATGINDRGQIVGLSYSDNVPVPTFFGFPAISTFIWEKGEMKDIGGLGGHFTQPIALNQRGEIVGWSLLEGDQLTRSFIYRNRKLKDMGDLGGQNVYVHNINDYGVATGYSDIPAGTPVFGHPFIWKSGQMIDLGAPPTGYNCAAGQSVNIREQVVGGAGCNADGLGFPFFWEEGGPIVDLNTLVVPKTTFKINNAFSINDRGEIACDGALPTGENRACLLVPADDHEWCDKDDENTAVVEDSSAARAQVIPSKNEAALSRMQKDAMIKSFLKGSNRYRLPTQRDAPSK